MQVCRSRSLQDYSRMLSVRSRATPSVRRGRGGVMLAQGWSRLPCHWMVVLSAKAPLAPASWPGTPGHLALLTTSHQRLRYAHDGSLFGEWSVLFIRFVSTPTNDCAVFQYRLQRTAVEDTSFLYASKMNAHRHRLPRLLTCKRSGPHQLKRVHLPTISLSGVCIG